MRPDIVVKGREHESRFNPELTILEQQGARLVFSSGETFFSSMDLIRKEFLGVESHSISLPKSYMHRHNIDPSRLINLINQFSNLKLCVVGDLIIDEYITCEPLGMSQEDPTIVVTPIDSTRFIGGAGIVAAHAAGLGASVNFVSVSGKDLSRDYALESLASAGVKVELIVDDHRPTTLKQRFRSKGKSLLRVSHLHQGAISASLQNQLFSSIKRSLKEADLLVFSDFNYGCLPQQLVDKIVAFAKDKGIFMAADSQSSSQVGDISRFKGMDLITPTEREARLSTRNREDGLVVLVEQLRQQANAKNVLLKLGEEGLLINAATSNGEDWLTDRVDALNNAAKDVAGAGDSLLITSAMILACGYWPTAKLKGEVQNADIGTVQNVLVRAFWVEPSQRVFCSWKVPSYTNSSTV
jgi:rfaE bifunctional protein kinase chain/domain